MTRRPPVSLARDIAPVAVGAVSQDSASTYALVAVGVIGLLVIVMVGS